VEHKIKLNIEEKKMQGNNTFKSELKGISGEIKKVWKNIVIKNYFFDSGNVRVNIQLRYSCLHAN